MSNGINLTQSFRTSAHNLEAVIKAAIEDLNITPAMFDILNYLHSAGPSNGNALRKAHIGSNYVYIANVLDKEGFVVRGNNPHDGRQTIYTLTQKGEAVVEKSREKITKVLQESGLATMLAVHANATEDVDHLSLATLVIQQKKKEFLNSLVISG